MQKLNRDVKIIKRFGGLFFMCFLCLMFWNTKIMEVRRFDYEDLIEGVRNDQQDYCDGELFAYRHISRVGSKNVMQKGKPFSCSLLKNLKRFNLTKEHEINETIPSNFPDDLIFVSAADVYYYESVKSAFASVRRRFGSRNKFILYDLGGIKEKHEREINKMCNIELRKFDFDQLPEDVQNLQVFSWKIFILAEVFNQATNVIYLDSSIQFVSGDYRVFFDLMTNGFQITSLMLSGYTGHSVEFATNPQMYTYLPIDFNVKKNSRMLEANLILMHKSEATREILKWAVLCASTLKCIDPPGTKIICDISRKAESGICNRQDQSVLSILTYNLENKNKRQGFRTIATDDPKHPNNNKQRHTTERGQSLSKKANLSCKG
ncbi:hypothetical protein M3Y97_00344800 [Aphelenchoides bicaudatus]|nr:hypothetical protein M3Y97_00344800 [Aphelenchoides bicaudatus]